MRAWKGASVVLVTGVILASSLPALTERSAPARVPPITWRGVRYEVNHAKMGIVEAREAGSGKLLWERKIYSVFYLPLLEKDVQDVYITSLSLRGTRLLIVDEKKRVYELDPVTRKVRRIK